jgi:DNA replication protein DnaC
MKAAKEAVRGQGRLNRRKESTVATTLTSSSQIEPCSLCPGDGWLVSGGFARPCQCQIEQRITSALQLRYRTAKLLDFDLEVQQAIRAWLKKTSDGLLISGPSGTGKTHLGAAILRECLQKGRRAIFRRCADLYAALRETYRAAASEGDVLREYFGVPFLVLDDLGSGGLSDHERRNALEILDQRLNRSLPTVVTSNLGLDAIARLMDDRIASRLAGFFYFQLSGPDRRLCERTKE